MFEVDFRERFFRTVEVAKAAFQHGTSPEMIASRCVMKRHRQLDHSLEVATQAAVAWSLPPDVFQHLMRVEEAGGIEERYTVSQPAFIHDFGSIGTGPGRCQLRFLIFNLDRTIQETVFILFCYCKRNKYKVVNRCQFWNVTCCLTLFA